VEALVSISATPGSNCSNSVVVAVLQCDARVVERKKKAWKTENTKRLNTSTVAATASGVQRGIFLEAIQFTLVEVGGGQQREATMDNKYKSHSLEESRSTTP